MEECVMFMLDIKSLEKNIWEPIHKDNEHKVAEEEFVEVLNSLDEEKMLSVEEKANRLETIASKKAYQQGFNDGIKFIIDVIAGKEVFEL